MTRAGESTTPELLADIRNHYENLKRTTCGRTDRQLMAVMVAEWIFAIVISIFVSPRAWGETPTYQIPHLQIALAGGAALSSLPFALALLKPGLTSTRHIIAVGQMLWTSLLIHLMAGRIEAHFLIFGSIAFLSFYRDWKVILTATIVVAADHILRGIFWPESIFGAVASEQWRWLEHAGYVIFEDVILVFSIIARDRELYQVSDRQVRLQESHAITESVVEKRTSALIIANRAKSDFISNISHELRTPLNGILGVSELLQSAKLNPLERGYLGTLVSSAESLLDIVNDILDFSRLEERALKLDVHTFDLGDLLEQLRAACIPDANLKNLNLVFDVPGVLPQVKGDRDRLRRILSNLLSNAIKFTDAGSVSLKVESELNGNNVELVFAVADTGIGIPEAHLEEIFQSFNQADNSSTRKFGGTGLGLTITRRLVDLMAGGIQVESEVGHGSTFKVSVALEIVAESAPELHLVSSTVEPLPKKTSLPNFGVHVLIVEDNPVNRRIAEAIVTRLGCTFLSVENGRLAVETYRSGKFDCILMDLQMPEMGGIEATRFIRQMEEGSLRRAIICALTASGGDSDRKECFESGMEHFISKPFKQEQLIEMFSKYFGEAPIPIAA